MRERRVNQEGGEANPDSTQPRDGHSLTAERLPEGVARMSPPRSSHWPMSTPQGTNLPSPSASPSSPCGSPGSDLGRELQRWDLRLALTLGPKMTGATTGDPTHDKGHAEET